MLFSGQVLTHAGTKIQNGSRSAREQVSPPSMQRVFEIRHRGRARLRSGTLRGALSNTNHVRFAFLSTPSSVPIANLSLSTAGVFLRASRVSWTVTSHSTLVPDGFYPALCSLFSMIQSSRWSCCAANLSGSIVPGSGILAPAI